MVLTVNRPDRLNALSRDTLAQIGRAVRAFAEDTAQRALIVTGAGEKSFVAGADIAELAALGPAEAEEYSRSGQAVMDLVERSAKPVIAAINGYALGGGCELALACDWIVASDKAVFGQPEVNLGICPGFGGTQRLSRLVGKGMALELCTTGRMVKADEALRIGLVNHVVAPSELAHKGLELARLIAAKGPVAVKMTKHLIQRGQDIDLANANAMEADVFGLLCASDDKREGMTAFLDKRTPNFAGR
jgi:enoyl-CoA hydratase